MSLRLPTLFLVPALGLLVAACGKEADGDSPQVREVRLYVALDQEHSSEHVAAFAKQSGVTVHPRYDSEANKTVGLVTNIIEEADAGRTRCDVFWNNEIAHTVRLGQRGMLAPYESPAAAGLPARWRDENHLWTGFAARARIIVVNKKLLPDPADWPRSYLDLIDPKWKGQCAVAKPLTGTTLTHFVALRGVLGQEKFDAFVDGLFSNEVRLLMSNGATMRETQAGKVKWAFTDTDDFHVSLLKGHDVAAVFPDQGEGQIGTMLIPNSVAIVKDAPHPEAARELVDYIVSAEMEATLAAARSAQIPLRKDVKGPAEKQILQVGAFRQMEWDLQWTATNLSDLSQQFQSRFGL